MIKEMEASHFACGVLPSCAVFRKGQATLSFVLLISGVIIEVAVASSVIMVFLSSAGLGERLSARASEAAQAGIRDVQIKIARDKEFCVSCTPLSPLQYNFNVGMDAAAVRVARVEDASNNSYIYTATSIGTASSRQRKFEVVLIVDRTTGIVQLQSLSEQSVQ